jgi:hypothetical protein
MPQAQPHILGPYGYDGGLNTDASIIMLPKGQLSSMTDMVVNQGHLNPIPGFSNAGITQPAGGVGGSSYFTGLLGFTLSGHNYLIYPWINTGGSSASGVYSVKDFTGSLSGNISGGGFSGFFQCAYCCEVMNNVAFMGVQSAIINTSPPSGNFASWTGTGSMSSVTTPAGAGASGIIKQVNNFMFLLLSNGTLYWSAVGDGLTWPASNFLTFRFGDKDIATALGRIRNTLYIFKMNCVGALQTQTTVISGAVTLGPLYPVFENIGTFSMRSLDNLPTGEIVFLGTDYNVYKFDGSNLTNISNRPYPQSSIQGAIDEFLKSASFNTSISSNLLWIRVNPLQHCVYLMMGGQINFGQSSGTICFAYDYVRDYWYQPSTSFGDFVCMASIGNISGWVPSAVGEVFIGISEDGTSVKSLSNLYNVVNGPNNYFTSTATISIPYTLEARNLIPRSLVVPLRSFLYPSAGYTPSVTISLSADGVSTGQSVTLNYTQLTGNLQRVIFPINFSDSTSTIQVTIQFSSGGSLDNGGYIANSYPSFYVDPIYLDTEIAH